jgi:signal transduction histidine kinase
MSPFTDAAYGLKAVSSPGRSRPQADVGRYPRAAMKRGDRRAVLVAAVVILGVGLLDYVTPPDADFGDFYMLGVVVAAWLLGWRVGVVFALLATVVQLVIDSSTGALSSNPSVAVFLWNGSSTFLLLAALAFVTDRVFIERERWRSVDAERRTLLRLLEQELPRPLRAADWFARTFEDALGGLASDTVRAQFAVLRRHTREGLFLAMDLLALGHLRSGGLVFQLQPVALNQLVTEAAADTLDRARVLLSLSPDDLTVLAEPDRLRHAISSVVARCLELSPYEQVTVLTRASGEEAAVEISCRTRPIEPGEIELAAMLVAGNRGRLVIVPRTANRGSVVTIYVPRAISASPARPSDAAVQDGSTR